MRERPVEGQYPIVTRGITPAHAGKTTRKTLRIHSTRDHPRACGKDQLKVSTPLLQGGSPLRMRERHPQDEGKGRLRDHPRACGKDGKTLQSSSTSPGSPPRMRERHPQDEGKGRLRDHPRACGKDAFLIQDLTLALGSPPRMRERPYRASLPAPGMRITPAHAGKTRGQCAKDFQDGDHPACAGKTS
jgi:hypothetical protein